MGEDPEPVPDPHVNNKSTGSMNENDSTSFALQTPIATSPVTPVDGRRRSSAGNRDYRTLYNDLKIKTKEYTRKTEEQLAAHQDEINALKEKLEKVSTKQRFVRAHGEEQFLTKAKKKKCEFSACSNDTEDALIKCNVCGLWVCEMCNDITISKLKPLMNKCSGVYFACTTCRESNIMMDHETETLSELSTLVSTLQEKEQSLSKQLHSANKDNGDLRGKIEALENEEKKIQDKLTLQGKMIQHSRQKLEEREAELSAQQTKFDEAGNPDFDNIVKLEQCMKKELLVIGNSIKESLVKEIHENNKRLEMKLNLKNPFSKPPDEQNADDDEVENNLSVGAWGVRAPIEDFRAILKETQNEQLNEANDQKIRARNLIIHGVQEDPTAEPEVRKNKDQVFIKSFLQTIALNDISYKTVQ